MRVLYCGDTTLDTAAAYLGGLITRWNWDLTYVASHEKPDDVCSQNSAELDLDFNLFVFSDYPAARISFPLQERILSHVQAGAGLVMIGGWESYHGLGGDWDGTPVGNALPVEISSDDDRVNSDRPVLVDALLPTHPITTGLPWRERPPVIGGFNRLGVAPSGEVLLEAVTHEAVRSTAGFEIRESRRDPLLIAGHCDDGRTLALATDVAPHWVGPLVDWGDDRVAAQATGGEPVEVGNLYATFLHQMLIWAANI